MNSLLDEPIPSTPPIPRRTVLTLYGMVGFMNAAIIFVLWKAFFPVTIIAVNQHPLPILYSAGNPYEGRSVAYRLDYCKSDEDAIATVIRELRQVGRERVVSLSTTGYALPGGCHNFDVVEPIPAYVPIGRYTLRLTYSYRVGSYRNEPAIFESEEFEVR